MNTVDTLNNAGFRSEFSSSKQVPYWVLEGAGFSVLSQMSKLVREHNAGVKVGVSSNELIQAWLEQTRQDVIGFKIEYLQRGLVLPIPIVVERKGEIQRLVGGGYGHQSLLDTISEQERKGAVKKSVAAMEDFILKADNGSIAVMTSPPGWSGFKADVSGKEINYEDTQTYIFKKNLDGSLEAATIVTDMGVGENISFLNKFGLLEQYAGIKNEPDKDLQRDKELLAQIVGQPVLLSGKGKERFFEDVVDAIREVKHNKDRIKIRTSTGVVNKDFQDIYKSLDRMKQLLDLEPTVAKLLAEFNGYVGDISAILSRNLGNIDLASLTEDQLKNLVLTNPTLANIGKRLGDLVLSIKMATDGSAKNLEYGFIPVNVFQQEAKKLAMIPGCNGGGVKTVGIPLGARNATVISSEAYQNLPSWRKDKSNKYYCIQCGACKKVIEQVVMPGESCPDTPGASCGAKREC